MSEHSDMPTPNRNRDVGFGTSRIKRHRIDNWEYFEVKKEELDILQNGSQSDKLFDCAIACGSAGISFFIAWLATDYNKNQNLFHMYLTIWIILVAICIIFFILSSINRKKNKNIFEEIRKRTMVEDS